MDVLCFPLIKTRMNHLKDEEIEPAEILRHVTNDTIVLPCFILFASQIFLQFVDLSSETHHHLVFEN